MPQMEFNRDRLHAHPELTIVMPCLNEAETLESCIEKAQRYLRESGVTGEIVIGDNGSTDGSIDIALRGGARVIHVPVRGYGAALYAACKEARGRFIVMGDSDDSYDFSDLNAFVSRLREGNDLVMGNRFTGEIKPGAMPWKNRYIGNPVLSGIGHALFPSNLGDFHCGMRAFTRAAFDRMDLRTTGMEFASEMVIKATLLEMKLSEVPITLAQDGRSRPPHLRPYRDGWRHLRFMLLFSPNWLFLYPGLILMATAGLLGLRLEAAPLLLPNGMSLDVDTLIYCSFAVLIGFQSVMFSMLSRMYAVQESLYPITAASRRFFHFLTLESGLIVGSLLTLAGFATAVRSLSFWRHQAFGALDPSEAARLVIPAATAMALGIEIVLFSFFLSTLGLGVRRDRTQGAEGLSVPAEQSENTLRPGVLAGRRQA
jgi:glycosyltransferase involved in cell wall biosynthesis